MWVCVDFCLIPVGVGITLSPYIAACQKILKKNNLVFELGPNGTAIQGEWNEVFNCIEKCHQEIHRLGANRIFTTLKVSTRIDKKESFNEKVLKVRKSLE